MTIASQINRIKTNIADTYTVLEEKGATLPIVQNSDNLANCAESITSSDVAGDSDLVALIDRSITSISNANVTSIGNYAFNGCSKLTSAKFSNVTSINTYAFRNCSKLTSIDFSRLKSIGASVFLFCTELKLVVLRNTANVCTLTSANVLSNTPIDNGTGYIYVPDELVDSYKTATNWVTYANQIKPLSEYESEV